MSVGESAVSSPRVAVTCHAYVRRACASICFGVLDSDACGRGVASTCLTALYPSLCPIIYSNLNLVAAWGVALLQITTQPRNVFSSNLPLLRFLQTQLRCSLSQVYNTPG